MQRNALPSIALVSIVSPVIMQSTRQLHHNIIVAFLGISEHILDDTASLDPRYDVLDHHADARNQPVAFLVLVRKLGLARLLFRLMDGHILKLMPLETSVSIEVNAIGKLRSPLVADFFVMLFALVGSAQILDSPVFQSNYDVVFQRVAFFFPL